MNIEKSRLIILYNKYRYLQYIISKKTNTIQQKQKLDTIQQNEKLNNTVQINSNDIEIENCIENTIKKILILTIPKRISLFKSCKIIKYFNKNTLSDKVYLLDNYIVCKVFKSNQKGFVLWKNELNTLQKILTLEHVPKLIAYSKLIIYMTYCGKLINKSNLPNNWIDQIDNIFNEFIRVRINPNDILEKNICVLNSKIKFIDFGLANNNITDLRKSHVQIVNNLRKLK